MGLTRLRRTLLLLNQGKGTERMPGFHWFARTVRWAVHAGDWERIVASSRGICMFVSAMVMFIFNHFQSLLRPVNIIIIIMTMIIITYI